MEKYPISKDKDKKFSVNNDTSKSQIDINKFFRDSNLIVEGCHYEGTCLRLFVSSDLEEEICPYCQKKSSRIHSRYTRTLHDLPCFGKETVILFNARKFFCDNTECDKKTFAEQPGNQIFRYRRRTCRCETEVYRHALPLSSIQAAALLKGMGISISRSTITRDVHRLRLPHTGTLSRIGVDDWAFRKGISYGTIIVDLDSGHVCDLLGTREESDFSAWLSHHPHIHTVSRDRSSEYSAAIRSTDPEITEVADRFHLLKNMSECVTKVICANYQSCVAHVNGQPDSGTSDDIRDSTDRNDLPCKNPAVKQREKEYVNEVKYNEVKRLQKEGKSINETARIMGIARQTVRKYQTWSFFHPPAPRPRLPYHLFTSYVEKEYAAGKDMKAIFREVKAQGFSGSRTPFFDHFRYLLDGHRGRRSQRDKERMSRDNPVSPNPQRIFLPAALSVAMTVCKDISGTELDDTEIQTMIRLWGLDWFDELHKFASEFWSIVKNNSLRKLLLWIEKYRKSRVPRIVTFVKGILLDIQAVKNTLIYPISNGIVEGYVNKLKTIKRTLYGRAKLHLLQRKLIMPRWLFN